MGIDSGLPVSSPFFSKQIKVGDPKYSDRILTKDKHVLEGPEGLTSHLDLVYNGRR